MFCYVGLCGCCVFVVFFVPEFCACFCVWFCDYVLSGVYRFSVFVCCFRCFSNKQKEQLETLDKQTNKRRTGFASEKKQEQRQQTTNTNTSSDIQTWSRKLCFCVLFVSFWLFLFFVCVFCAGIQTWFRHVFVCFCLLSKPTKTSNINKDKHWFLLSIC